MKKLIGILLAAALAFQGSIFTAFADDTEKPIYEVNINNICTLLLVGEKPQFSVELDPALEGVEFVSGKLIDSNNKEVTISGDNIAVAGGKYRFELKLSSKDGFAFDNQLTDVYYQGVDVENYQMTYEFPPDGGNHTMIVRGDFGNIVKVGAEKIWAMAASGKFSDVAGVILDNGNNTSNTVYVDKDNSKASRISGDKYSYELVLKTKEGFSFNNALVFLYNEDKYGFNVDYTYSLSDNNHTLKIKGFVDKKQVTPKPSATELKPGISALEADRIITNKTGESDLKGTGYSKLKLRSTTQTKTVIKLKWQKPGKAKTYVIYGNKCGSKNKLKKLGVSKGNTFPVAVVNRKSLKAGAYYKFMIVALDKDSNVVSASKMIYVTKKGNKVGNHKSVKVSKTVIAKAKKLKKGKTLKLKAKAVPQSKKLKVKKYVSLRYESTNSKIATVNKKGKITAKAKGTCYVYAYAQDGVFKKVKVKVK